ncbi:hypothetical protein BJ546DRAFT_1063713 [Cryomyces antarcticus]
MFDLQSTHTILNNRRLQAALDTLRSLARASPKPTTRTLRTFARPRTPHVRQVRLASHTPPLVRHFSVKSTADEKIEEITELYATAKDEFEIAHEETTANTVYASDDRDAARTELDNLTAAYRAVVDGPDKELAEEVQRRVGGRIRELENAVKAMEEMALHQD